MAAAAVKNESINGSTPLPQRNPKNQNQNNQGKNVKMEDELPEKKPRFGNLNQQQGDGGNFQQGQSGQQGGGQKGGNFNRGGGGGGPQNQNRRDHRNRGGRNNIGNENDGQQSGGGGNMGSGGNMGGGDRRGGNMGGGDRRGGGGGGGGGGGRGEDFFIARRLEAISGPTHEIPPIEQEDMKFSGRNRLYVGNLTGDVGEEELREMFKPYGEIAEVFANKEKNFAFLKVDYHANAEKAKRELDGMMRKGRTLRVRFAPNGTILKVLNLTPYVSNELLFKSFEIFGPVERAVIIVDDRGKHTGEGIVEFAKKSSAMAALRLCNDRCFFLTSSLRPVVLEQLEINDETDGFPDKAMNKKTQDFYKERNNGPRFADLNSFEHEYGSRWKQLHELYKSKQEALKRELKLEEDKLEAQMDFARYEHETEMLRQELRKREQDNERKKAEWELREKQAEEQRLRDEEQLRRQENEMQMRMSRQEEEMRRRQQENTLFMQAQKLNSLLDQHENVQGSPGQGFNSNQQQNLFDFRGGNNNMGNNQQDPQFNPLFAFGNQQNQPNDGGNQQRGGGDNGPWERRERRRF